VTSGPTPEQAFQEALKREDPETIYQRAPCGYLSTTPDGTLVRVNDTFLRWTGHSRDELVGRRTFTSLLSAGGRIYHDTHYAPMLQLQGTVREIALDVVCADGSRLPVLANAALESDESGRPVLARIVLFDATERREYERELMRAKHRAEASESRARALAMTLQQTLIPPNPPSIPGLEISSCYRPAGSGEEVGGDFYDVFEIGEDDWTVTLGDVCGKGTDAAVVSALVRHTIRAVTVRVPGPADVLHALDEVLLHHPTERFCTVALLRLRRREGRWRFSMSLGGHPRPLLLTSHQATENVGEPGSLVGALPGASFTETEGDLVPGSTLVLFTDGVTEGRRGQEQYGEDRLRIVAEQHRGEPVVAESILADVLTFQRGTARDDIAVVTITVPEPV
jgi:sigma-B regulation protein RsbU (phosphoserine phosphatase)